MSGLILLASCNADDMPVPTNTKQAPQNSSYKISPEEAIANAKILVNGLNSSNTRSASSLTVKSIDIISSQKNLTRSGAPDTLLYVINFDDNEGFAVMSADRRTNPVYALSDESFFNITDQSNEGLQLLMASWINDVEQQSITPGIPLDSLNPNIDPYQFYRTIKVGPYLSKYQRSLTPYNTSISRYCKNSKGEPALTNRYAVVAEQFMSSQLFTNRNYNWDLINEGKDEESVAEIVFDLGNKMHAVYYDLKTPATCDLTRFEYAMLEYGFGYCNYFPLKDNEKELIQYLDSDFKDPVCIMASSSKMLEDAIWIIDGYLGYLTPFIESKIFKRLYHCVWSDGGNCNGYYDLGNNCTFIGEPRKYESSDPYYNYTESSIYYDVDVRACILLHDSQLVGI